MMPEGRLKKNRFKTIFAEISSNKQYDKQDFFACS